MRNRLWRVDNVLQHEFTATPIDGRDTYARRFLTEVEHLEEGEVPFPDASIVTDPAEQDLLLRAFRLSLVHGSAPLLGLQRSRAIPTPYQLVPLLLAVGRERVRLLIADDVGVGKTIEMGLVVSELLARSLVHRALFVVPANLREQTREALAHFFHIDATIVSRHRLRSLERSLMPGQSVWEAHPFVVVSVDYAKKYPGRILDAGWDLVVFDEAHLCARPPMSTRGNRAQKQRYDFAVKAAEVVQHLIMMTATPHNGYTESFASLLDLLDVDAVRWSGPSGEVPTIDRQKAEPHVIQRRREDLRGWFEAAGERFPFPERDPYELIIEMSATEARVMEDVRTYTERLATRSDATVNQWVALHLQKRALSSPAALRRSLQNRVDALRRRLTDEVGTAADAEAAVMDAEPHEDLTDEQLFDRVDRSALGTESEIAELERLKESAAKVTKAKDSKYSSLVQRVWPHVLARQRNKRLIVFTRYRDTLDYLVSNLEADARRPKRGMETLSGTAVFAIHGDMNPKDRIEAFASFEAADKAILVATDVISEGVNLQRACSALVHYELPWNPNRLEQRNGRVDRYLQPEERVILGTLVYDDELDVTILNVLVRKAAEIREEYGFSPPFFSSSRDLVDLMRAYGHVPARQLDLFSAAADASEEPQLVAMSREAADRMRDEGFYGHDSVELREVQEALAQTNRTVGDRTDLELFVRAALGRFGAGLTDVGADRFEADLSRSEHLADLSPDGEPMVLTLDAELAREDLSVDVVDLAHPLVRRLVDLVRDEGVGNLDGSQVGRVTGYAHPSASEVTVLAHVLARFLSASAPPVLMEELVPVAVRPWSEQAVVPSEEAVGLLSPARAMSTLYPSDVADAVSEVVRNGTLDAAIAHAIGERQADLESRGRQLAQAGGPWAAGMADLSLASRDILTLTVVEPPAS